MMNRPASTIDWLIRAALLVLFVGGIVAYTTQHQHGLAVTGLSRDAPWGLYISQFTFLVGIGASAVTVVLPYYVHHQRALGEVLVLGEMVAITALLEAITFILVDLGQPARVLNVLLHPAPSSLMFWDVLTLSIYLVLSALVLGLSKLDLRGWAPRWTRRLAFISIPFAFGIHVITALLYAGLAARPGFLSALLAPRFLATAFASGPALLILLTRYFARRGLLEVRNEALGQLATIMTYATVATVVFTGLEAFTALYSGIPEAGAHIQYQYVGLEGHQGLRPWALASLLLSLAALPVLLSSSLPSKGWLLQVASGAVLSAVLVEKGFCLISSGFVPSPLGYVQDYRPSLTELSIVIGIHAGGALAFMLLAPLVLRARTISTESSGASSGALLTLLDPRETTSV